MSAGLKDVLIRYLQNENPGDKAELKQYIDFGKFQSFKKRVVRNFNQQKADSVKPLEYNNKSFKDAYANPESRDLISNIIRDLPMGYKSESPPPTTVITENEDVTGSGSSNDPYLQTARVPKYLEKNVNKQIAKQQRRMAMQQAQQSGQGQPSPAKQLQPIQKAPMSGKGPATVTPVAQPATQSQPAQIPVQPQPAQIPVQPQQPQVAAKIQGPIQPQQGQVQSVQQVQMPVFQQPSIPANAQSIAQALDSNMQAVAKAQQMQLQQAQQLLQLQQQHSELQNQVHGQIVQPVSIVTQPVAAQPVVPTQVIQMQWPSINNDTELPANTIPAPISNAMPTTATNGATS